jgi:hypothetical protein
MSEQRFPFGGCRGDFSFGENASKRSKLCLLTCCHPSQAAPDEDNTMGIALDCRVLQDALDENITMDSVIDS